MSFDLIVEHMRDTYPSYGGGVYFCSLYLRRVSCSEEGSSEECRDAARQSLGEEVPQVAVVAAAQVHHRVAERLVDGEHGARHNVGDDVHVDLVVVRRAPT